jgi:hypothetical protein
MEGLGYLGLLETEQANRCFEAVLALDESHQGAVMHLQLTDRFLSTISFSEKTVQAG